MKNYYVRLEVVIYAKNEDAAREIAVEKTGKFSEIIPYILDSGAVEDEYADIT